MDRDHLPPAARRGLRLLNEGRWFEAHEELEQAWLTEPGPRRGLWKGLLQLGVAWLHLERGNPRGARSLVRRGRRQLAPFLPSAAGLDLERVDALAASFQSWLDAREEPAWSELPADRLLRVERRESAREREP